MPPYQPSSQINHADTETLVVYCSDHRLQAGIREFLNAGLNLDNNYDLLVIPGGPQCLSLIEYLPKFAWAGRRWLNFLKDAHAIKRIILVAHQDCGW